MTAYMILGIGVLLIFFSLINRKSKYLTKIIYIYLFVVYTFCNGGTPDLEVYEWTYREQINASFIGFDTLMNIFSMVGIPFVVFKGFCGLFTLFFLSRAFGFFLKEENVALALYIIWPFFDGVSQIKNGMMSALVLYAVLKYIKDPKHKLKPYVITILFASLIHAVAIVYLLFIFARKNFKNNHKIIFIFAVSLIVLVEMIIKQNLVYNIASMFITNEHYLEWFDYKTILETLTEEKLNIKGKLLPACGQLMGYGLFLYLSHVYRSRFHVKANEIVDYEYSEKTTLLSISQLNMIGNIQLLMLFILPFYQMNHTYFRIYKNMVPILYILVAQLAGRKYKKNTIFFDWTIFFTIVAELFAAIMSAKVSGGFSLSMYNSFSLFN